MSEIVAYCGLVCSVCPAYQATQNNDNAARARLAAAWTKQHNREVKPEEINCDGCLPSGQRRIDYCSMCEIRKCGTDKKVLNCAYCVQYPCDKLIKFQALVPDAKTKLESIKKKN